ncbi:MAG: hypothetical protein WA148_06760 [Actinomycetota bacterium]
MDDSEKKTPKELEEIELYKKIRKRVAPPTRVTPNKRRKIKEKEAEKEIEEQKRRG